MPRTNYALQALIDEAAETGMVLLTDEVMERLAFAIDEAAFLAQPVDRAARRAAQQQVSWQARTRATERLYRDTGR
jgi:hypothetical protein